jgi:hypothetical protein
MRQKFRGISKVTVLLLCVFSWAHVCGQSEKDLFEKGMQCRKDHDYKDGILSFQRLMKLDSSNAIYLSQGSYFYSRYGYSFAEPERKMAFYKVADYLARKAIRIDPSHAEAHYAYALALGRMNENASTKQKIANSKLIKSELDKTLKLQPKHADAYHILGRWHRTIAGFNAIEKLAINTLFGGVPEGGSYEEAILCFRKAISYDPLYKLHPYELAVTLKEMGKKADAKVWAKRCVALPSKTLDDKNTDINAKALLDELGK